jgi:hypothetical protein
MRNLAIGRLVLVLVWWCCSWGWHYLHTLSGRAWSGSRERKIAELAYLMGGEYVADVPGPGIWTAAYKETDIEECPSTPALEKEARFNAPQPPPPPPFDAPPFSAKFQTYTIFGIPAGTVSMPCEVS